MQPPSLLLLVPDRELTELTPILNLLGIYGVYVDVPQQVTRIGDSIVAVLDDLVSKASTVLTVNSAFEPGDAAVERARLAFRARVTSRAALREVILDRAEPSPRHRYASAVVIPGGLSNVETAKLIRTVVTASGRISTLRAPPNDNPNSPFITSGAWPISFLHGPPTRSEVSQGFYDEALTRYWAGLNRSGYLGEWRPRLILSRKMVREATAERDLESKSLILTKGIAYTHIVAGAAAPALRALKAASDAARAARNKRAHSYVLSYVGDVCALRGAIGDALRSYDEASSELRGMERREVLLKNDLLRSTRNDAPRSEKLRSLEALKSAFDDVFNYRAGAVDVEIARELAIAGDKAGSLERLAEAESFFTERVPMPRNADFVRLLRDSVVNATDDLPRKTLW